ncbi:MAG TPA: ATP-binding cassette domain-containing protein [Nocardioides sp.]|jgi:ABC-type multidrug transport system ATPase subunit|nr:ATP-binding cassette domain-containing protein [Nocardioides sp.]
MTLTHHTLDPERTPTPALSADPPTLVAEGVVVQRGSRRLLDHVSLSLAPGELVAVIGASGAGKSTLLAALAGLTRTASGSVGLVTREGRSLGSPYGAVGLVPQDDILHPDLPLERTLRHAAGLRLAGGRRRIGAAVHDVLHELDLAERAAVPVGSLSGGQRKRASIAVELLARPTLFLLDEPTSGLDPATSRSLVRTLRNLADRGDGIAFTTHSVADVEACDRLVVLAAGGRLVFDGPPELAADHLGADTLTDLYDRLADPAVVTASTDGADAGASMTSDTPTGRSARLRAARRTSPGAQRPRPSTLRQFSVLTHRAAEIVMRNRLTLGILLGSPAAVIAMFAILFQPGALSPGVDPTGAVMEAYWLAFAGFFFGLTYGLLQVVSEVPVLRREHQSGVSDAAYLASKVALLAPVLLVVNAVMLGVLRVTDRLPDLGGHTWATLFVTLGVNAVVALFLGLLASATVTSVAQAALALPMLCFPAVLFSGAMVPVPVMTSAGAAIAAAMPDRWAFEAIARHLQVSRLVSGDSPYADLGASSYAFYWTVLGATGLLLAVAAYLVLRRRAR